MEIIKYEGFGSTENKYFFALTREKNIYYMFFANVGNISIETQSEESEINLDQHFLFQFVRNKTANLKIDFLSKHNTLFKTIQLKSKEDYDTIITVVKDLL